MSKIKKIVLNEKIYEIIKFVLDSENTFRDKEISFSRLVNYLLVLGLDKYCDINKTPRFNIYFDLDKKSGYHNYKISDLETKKRELLRKHLISLGRSFFETD
jgi:hypothetical protein